MQLQGNTSYPSVGCSSTAQHSIACSSPLLPNYDCSVDHGWTVRCVQGLRCPKAAEKLMDAAEAAMGLGNPRPVEDSAFPGNAVLFLLLTMTLLILRAKAGSLMKEAQGVYQTNCTCVHIHTPHFGKCSSKESSAEFFQPTIPLEIAPLPEEFANNNVWPLFKTSTRASRRWFTTRQSESRLSQFRCGLIKFKAV